MARHRPPGATLITQQQVDDQLLGERYLAGQLSESEQAAFEQYYTSHPQTLDDLQTAASIKIGLALLRTSGELHKLTAPRRAAWQIGLALAASLLIATSSIGYLTYGRPQPQSVIAAAAATLTDASGVPLRILGTYDVQRTRSDVDASITKPVAEGILRLRLRDELQPSRLYRLELCAILAGEARHLEASLGKITPAEPGSLNIYVNAAKLQPGSYELRLYDEARDIHLTDFLIDIVAEDDTAGALSRFDIPSHL